MIQMNHAFNEKHLMDTYMASLEGEIELWKTKKRKNTPPSPSYLSYEHFLDAYLKNDRIEWDVQDIIKEHNFASCKIK